MNIQDILFKKQPLVIDGENIQGAFVKPLPVSKLIKLSGLNKEKDNFKTIDSMAEIINISIVGEDGKALFASKDMYDSEFMGKCINAIMEVNSSGMGK